MLQLYSAISHFTQMSEVMNDIVLYTHVHHMLQLYSVIIIHMS